jgi:hypothetical protein
MATHQQNEVISTHNPTPNSSKKKQVKFSKNLTTTSKKIPSKKWRSTKVTSAQTPIVGKSALAATAPAENTYYYYYYYNDTETHQLPTISDEQQQVYNNIAGNYYYYAIDGTSGVNNDIFIQPNGSAESYHGQSSWR